MRLLKNEEEATRQLSELAGRGIDRFAVAKKRATISNKLIPWLLKHFSQDSTVERLKIVVSTPTSSEEYIVNWPVGSAISLPFTSRRRRSQNHSQLLSIERQVLLAISYVRSSRVDEFRRCSLGRSITASPHLPLRILATNILREISLADIDIRLFWSSDLLENNGPHPPSSFIADVHWLHNTVKYLRDVDDRETLPDERYARIIQRTVPNY